MKKPEKMTPEEIVRFLAERVMGWTEERSGIGQFMGWFSGMKLVCNTGSWNPLTDANDMLMVIETMREKGARIHHECSPHGKHCLTFAIDCAMGSAIDNCLKRAVCLAAIKAVKATKEKENDN